MKTQIKIMVIIITLALIAIVQMVFAHDSSFPSSGARSLPSANATEQTMLSE